MKMSLYVYNMLDCAFYHVVIVSLVLGVCGL